MLSFLYHQFYLLSIFAREAYQLHFTVHCYLNRKVTALLCCAKFFNNE